MVGCVDLARLLFRTVVEPQYYIAVVAVFVIEIGARHTDGFICVMGEDGEGAGGVKANTSDGASINVVLIDCAANRRAYAAPYVCSGLFLGLSAACLKVDCLCDHASGPAYIVACLRLPKANVFRSKSDDIALVVHDTGSRAARANIDANVVLDKWTQLIARVGG